MTVLTFPTNPTLGQLYNAPNQIRYVYDGVKWIVETVASTSLAVTNSVQDRVAPMLVAGPHTGIAFTYNVTTNALSANVTTNKLVNGVNELVLGTDGALENLGSWTKTTTNSFNGGVASQVVWTSTEDFISGAKLLIQLECDETGGVNTWETQMCEAVIAVRGHTPTTIPVISVYGVTHTSVAPLMTFTVDRNPTTSLIEITGTRTGTASLTSNAGLRIHSVETGTMD